MHLADVATAVGVQPSHLAHAFRRHFRTTVGAYVRSLRLDWALEQIARSNLSLAEIAAAAGYSDQSHLTRECRRIAGVSPGKHRMTVKQVRKPAALAGSDAPADDRR